MTDEVRNKNREIISLDSDEQLLSRFIWYVQNFNPVDDDRCEHYELVKGEILSRMRGSK